LASFGSASAGLASAFSVFSAVSTGDFAISASLSMIFLVAMADARFT
jgi:hypothetical protein